jgi:cellulose synthase/poly-beta-1,6-N-acetylglucosamine synthase-like glycosyltransferase
MKGANSPHIVERLADVDDIELRSNWVKAVHKSMPFFTLTAIIASFIYFGYRIHCTLTTQNARHKFFPMAWVFIIAETFVTFPQLFYAFYSFLALRGRTRPKLRLRGNNAPTVDVFVTCCKEDIDIILDTARAACAVDYPQDRFRVVVCDDGADPVLREAVIALREQHANLFYWARTKVKGKPHHFKAGNLIAATEMVTRLPSGAGEFIAALDADMIPEPHWLRTLMAHMVIDDKMSLVCPPQLFYNLPAGDPLYQSLDSFALVQEVIKDANGVAWCTGSGYVVRRAAIESIGGWPTGSLAEDVFTSSMLLGHGWKTAFVNEPLQYGLVPDTFTGHLKQRTRWTLGTLQTAAKLNFCLYGTCVKGMGFRQRLSGFLFPADNLLRLFISMAILAIPIGMISGKNLVLYTSDFQLRWQIRLGFAGFALGRVSELITFLPSGYRLARRDFDASLWMIPYNAITIIHSFLLPKWLGGKAMAFSPSGSLKSELNERDAAIRAPLYRRLKVILWDCKAYIHLLYVVFAVIAASAAATRATRQKGNWTDIWIYVLTHIAWPPMMWILSVMAFTTPISYAIWPPTVPDREELLVRDSETFIAHPKPECKMLRWTWLVWGQDAVYTAVTMYSTLAFVASFVL